MRTSSICFSVNGSTPLAAHRDHPDRLALAQQRHPDYRAHLPDRDKLGQRVFRIDGCVGNLDNPTFEYCSPSDGAAAGRKGLLSYQRVPFGRERKA